MGAMTHINDLRALMLEARIALRTALPDFDTNPLRARMEQAILNLTEQPAATPAPSGKTGAQQVALAWQTVCRGLKLSQPELYDELAKKVMNLLDERELVEPVAELLQLEAQVKQLEARQKAVVARQVERDKKAAEVQARLEQLYAALAAARPEPMMAPDAQSLALQRIEVLAAGAPSAGPRVPGRKGSVTPVVSPMPDRAVLEAVAAQKREFTKEQREWSVAECLALTGWEFTPLELIQKGDAWMAQQLLEAQAKSG